METKKIKSALISVFYKDNLEPIIQEIQKQGITIYSTGGTQKFIEEQGAECVPVEDLTSYPSIFGGRVKTLHPKVFGGILARRDLDSDVLEMDQYQVPEIDLVIVDLYPFEETVANETDESKIIEKIDIGGISLIRAAAKNYKDVLIISSRDQYSQLLEVLQDGKGTSTLQQRKQFATKAFHVSSHYDTAIFNYFNTDQTNNLLKISTSSQKELRYGENPHQKGAFYGDLNNLFEQLNGKDLSYNNLLDVDAAFNLLFDLNCDQSIFLVIKHNNTCGAAIRENLLTAWEDALAGDPVSAFGGILCTNKKIDAATAESINKIFFEVLIAPDYDADALELLSAKKNRIILKSKTYEPQSRQVRTTLNGYLVQDTDSIVDQKTNFELRTQKAPTDTEKEDLAFANILVKHTKSNTIVIAKNKQLLASGTGQTSRVDALMQAIEKAKRFNFELKGAVMASDAFFPFPDCVEIAHSEGIDTIIQPGGSIKDQESIDYCNEHHVSMVFTGNRHFKH